MVRFDGEPAGAADADGSIGAYLSSTYGTGAKARRRKASAHAAAATACRPRRCAARRRPPRAAAADRYLTAVDHLTHLLAPPAAAAAGGDGDGSPAARARAAVLARLAPRVPRLLDGRQLFSIVEACRLLPLGCEGCAA